MPRSESEQNARSPRHDWVSRESELFRFDPPSSSDSSLRIGTAFAVPSASLARRADRQKAKRAKGLPPARYFSPPRSEPLIPITLVRHLSCTSAQELSSPDQKCCIAPEPPNPRKPRAGAASRAFPQKQAVCQLISSPTGAVAVDGWRDLSRGRAAGVMEGWAYGSDARSKKTKATRRWPLLWSAWWVVSGSNTRPTD